jgi:hypothetical protein
VLYRFPFSDGGELIKKGCENDDDEGIGFGVFTSFKKKNWYKNIQRKSTVDVKLVKIHLKCKYIHAISHL